VISQFGEMSVNHIELYHTVPAKPSHQLIASGTTGLLVISYEIQYRRLSTLSVFWALSLVSSMYGNRRGRQTPELFWPLARCYSPR
jgi:hypothetical protein